MSKKLDLYFVLGGAVSAGSYTAGVLDYFMSQLKVYMQRPESDRSYDVKIKAIAGTSAGGMCGSVLFHSMAQGYNQVPQNSDLYQAWVKNIDILPLSSLSDLKDGKPEALLNGDPIRKIASDLFDKIPDQNQELTCNFMAPDCKVLLSITDTVGRSYAINFVNDPDEKPYYTTNHRDYYCFTLNKTGDNEIILKNKQDWELFKLASIATGAFPIGLPPVNMQKPVADYVNPPDPLGVPFNLGGEVHNYLAIDGGIGDNEPFGKLAEIIEYMSPKQDDREIVVIYVDPFVSETNEDSQGSLKKQLSALYSVLRNQSAFKPDEITKFRAHKEYHCFSIIPKRSNEPGIKSHLAGSFIGAFSGFIHEKYREHDYRLGMRNCQRFITTYFNYLEKLPPTDEVLPLDWPCITKKEFEQKTKPLDVRLSKVAGTFKNGFIGFLIKIGVRRIFTPSGYILDILEENNLVEK